ncbi:hypothetical protein J7L48_06405, partial [bacterium]|nr:hypothetical protein [bacterium]
RVSWKDKRKKKKEEFQLYDNRLEHFKYLSIIKFFNIPEGNITVYEIVHDAIPLTESLSDFFSKNPNSKYKNLPNEKYPLGLAGGNIKINQNYEKSAWFSLRDCGWNIGGYYSLEEEKDFINIKKLNDAEIFEMF